MRSKIIQFGLIALLVAVIGGSLGWYFFITNKTDETTAAANARGADASFTGEVGSTYQNIAGEELGTTTVEVGKAAPRLWHVVRTPVAGFGFGSRGTSIFIAERATGNILRADPTTSSILRLTNTLIPKVSDALFSRNGDVVLRSTNDQNVVTSFAASISTSTIVTATSTPNVLEGTYLPQNIVAIDAPNNQLGSKGLFYIAKVPEGGSIGVSSGWKGNGVKKMFSSSLSQWRAQALLDGRAVVVQAASDNVSGYAFLVHTNGSMKPLEGNLPGLTLLHHDSSDAYLYGTSDGGTLSLYVKVGTSPAVKLPIETIADKCVWAPGIGLIAYCAVPTSAPGTNFLAGWYNGSTHTQDVWWKIEAAEGKAERFFVPDTRVNFDVEDPLIDETGSAIGFRDAADKSLWLLRISE